MSQTKIRIEFVKPAQVERAPKDPKKGGFEIEKIPVGTIKEVSPASVNFWNARGCIRVLGPVQAVPVRAFGGAPVSEGNQSEGPEQYTKKQVKAILEAAIKAHNDNLPDVFLNTLAGLDLARAEDALTDLPSDSAVLFIAAVQDAKVGMLHGNPSEIFEAVLDAHDVTLAPSQRKRVTGGNS